MGRGFPKRNLCSTRSTRGGGGRQALSLTAASPKCCHVCQGYGSQSWLPRRARKGGRAGNFCQAVCRARTLIYCFMARCNADRESRPRQDVCPGICPEVFSLSLHAGVSESRQFVCPLGEFKSCGPDWGWHSWNSSACCRLGKRFIPVISIPYEILFEASRRSNQGSLR